MAAARVFTSRLASQMAVKAARPAVRAPVAAASKRTITGKLRQKFFLGPSGSIGFQRARFHRQQL